MLETRMKQKGRPIEEIYERLGPLYNFIYGKLLFNEGRRAAIDLSQLKPGDRVLEVGVGTGLTLPMYPMDCEVVGIDLSHQMLKSARELIARHHLKNAQVHFMNANALEFPDNSFDAIVGNMFISATSDPKGAMEEMKRVCKPSGHLVLMNHFKSTNRVLSLIEVFGLPLAKYLGFHSALDLDELLENAELKMEELQKVNLFNLWTAVSMKNQKA